MDRWFRMQSPINVTRWFSHLLYSACRDMIRSGNTEIGTHASWNKTTGHSAYRGCLRFHFYYILTECLIYDRALHVTPQSRGGLTAYTARNFGDLHEKRCSHILNPFTLATCVLGTNDLKKFYSFDFCKVLRERRAEREDLFPFVVSNMGAMLRARNTISPLSRTLFDSMQINSRRAIRRMSASPTRNKITSPDNTRHFILSVLSQPADKASHKFFNTSDLKINRAPRRMQKRPGNYRPPPSSCYFCYHDRAFVTGLYASSRRNRNSFIRNSP